MMNPSAMKQVHQFSKSVNELFKLMIQEKREEFVKRIRTVIIIIKLLLLIKMKQFLLL